MKLVHVLMLVCEWPEAVSGTNGFLFYFSVFVTDVKVAINACPQAFVNSLTLTIFSCNPLLYSLPTPVDRASLNLVRCKAHYTVYVILK
jgi:hypothetical protein